MPSTSWMVRTWSFLLFANGLFCLYQNQALIWTQGIAILKEKSFLEQLRLMERLRHMESGE